MKTYSQDAALGIRIEDEYPHGACEWCGAHLLSENPDACPCFQDEADKDETEIVTETTDESENETK